MNAINFTSTAANPYTISASAGTQLTISGAGIMNESVVPQNFVANPGAVRGSILFTNAATAGASITLTNEGGPAAGVSGGFMEFSETSSAGAATIINRAATVNGPFGGVTRFYNTSSAGTATINNHGAATNDDEDSPGFVLFTDGSTAGNATISNGGALTSGSFGGETVFSGNSTAGNATISTGGGAGSDYFHGGSVAFHSDASAGSATITNNGGYTLFDGNSTAGNATLIANGGADGRPGGVISFEELSTGGTARIQIFGNGRLQIVRGDFLMAIGSLEGSGSVVLGSPRLRVGGNNFSTLFSGVISGFAGEELIKVGTGTLTLSGANTYTGPTDVSAGALLVDGSLANTALTVSSGGTLGGRGTIGGPVTVANGGNLAPGDSPGTLTLQAGAQFAAGTALHFELSSPAGPSDRLDITGPFTLDGTLNVIALSGFGPGTYDLIDYRGGAFTDNGLELGNVPPDFTYSITTANPGRVELVVNPVPEPSAVLLAFAAAGVFLLPRRRAGRRMCG